MTTMKQVRKLVEGELYGSSVNTAWLGYGDPLFLEFARPNRRESNEPIVESAECELQTNFARWSIEGAISGDSERDNRDCLESASQSLIGAIVDDLELSADAVLTIRFDGSRLVRIIPWHVDDGHSDAWSLTLPNDRILAVSNAGKIAIVERHVPVRDWFANN